MYVFSRIRRINNAHGRAAMAAAAEAATRASEIIGMPVALWTPVLSAGIGTVVWSTTAEHLADLQAADDAITGSNEFMDWVEQNDSLFIGSLDDSVLQVLHGNVTGDPPAYVNVTRAVAAPGSVSEAMEMGLQLTEVVERITGVATTFGSYVTGTFGELAWAGALPDLQAAEAANAAMAASDELRKLIDSAGHVYQPGVTSMLLRRLN